jgi:hypothetical protein
MKTGVKNMDWTDLQENWVPLSDPEKFKKYAKENKYQMTVPGNPDTYFDADRGTFYDTITEFNFTTIPDVEKEIIRITESSNLKNNELLAKIVAVTMFKMRPREVTARERFAKWEKSAGSEFKEELPASVESVATVTVVPLKADNAPPDFWYPM